MSSIKIIFLSTLVSFTSLPLFAQTIAGPDSVVCRDAEGAVISRSVFTREGKTLVEDRYRIGSEPAHIRISSSYDSRGDVSSETNYTFDTKAEAWVMEERTDYSHGTAGRLIQKTAHDRNGFHTRTTYSYDANGRLLTEVLLKWNIDDNEWDPVKKYEYAYSYDRTPLDTREYVLRSHYHWASDAEGWVRQSGRESSDYDMAGRLTSRCRQEDNGTKDALCTAYKYSANGLLIESSTSCYESGDMIQHQKETYTYDSDDRVTTHKTYDRDGVLASEETYYYAKSHRKSKVTRAARLDSTVTTSADGKASLRQIFAYDGKGRRAAICAQTLKAGSWADSVSVAYAFDATGGKRYENIVTYKTEGQPEEHDITSVRENVLDENGKTVASYAYTADENGVLRLSGFTQQDNRYDSEGRITSAVTIGEGGRIDSTAYAYDVVNRYESEIKGEEPSGNIISRAWMRISGLFARTEAKVDTAEAQTTTSLSTAEKIVYTWNHGKWEPSKKSVATFDEYAKPHEVDHYEYDANTATWTPVRKEVFETSKGLVEKRVGHVYNPQKSAFEISERENFYYY